MKDGKPVGLFGVMGGYMQSQGHVQVLTNFIDFKLNPQSCLDSPRWQWIEGNRFEVESDFDKGIIKELEQRGHIIEVVGDKYSFGRGEFITINENVILVGAANLDVMGPVWFIRKLKRPSGMQSEDFLMRDIQRKQ